MTFAVQHVCLDKDGTLIDVHPYCRHLSEVRAQVLRRRFRLNATHEAELVSAMGIAPETGRVKPQGPVGFGPRSDVVAAVEAYLVDAGIVCATGDVGNVFAEIDRDQQNSDDFVVELLPGVRDFLEWLAKKRIPATIFSSDRKENTERILALTGIEHLILNIVGGGCVVRSKPHPEGFLRACDLARISPNLSAYVGDSALDVQVARNGGAAMAIGVTTGLAERCALVAIADRVCATLAELIGLDVGVQTA